jgi:hypothetical protein
MFIFVQSINVSARRQRKRFNFHTIAKKIMVTLRTLKIFYVIYIYPIDDNFLFT